MAGAVQPGFRVIPLPQVKSAGKKILTAEQLMAGISIVRMLKAYPRDVGLDYERCGEGFELHLSHPAINKQGWLRAGFWVHDASRTIYVVHLWWKKTNQVALVDRHLIDSRIRRLRAFLVAKQ